MDANVERQGRLVRPTRPYRLREWLSPLIKEARRRARRRRLRMAAGLFVLAVAGLGVGLGGLFNNGGGSGAAAARQPSLPVRETAAPGPVANGPLTLLANNHNDEQVAAVGVFGATGAIFHCSTSKGCYELTGFAWSPNGRWLAIGADTVSLASDYNGLHLINLATHRDIRVAWGHVTQFSWSRDGSKLAFVVAGGFSNSRGEIYVRDLTAPGSPKLLKTGTEGNDASPTWSPDARRIAFATKLGDGHWIVSEIGVDGRHSRWLGPGGSPSWSPDGRLIAYRGSCGRIALITPLGKSVRTRHAGGGPCAEIGVAGAPVWSPDGRQIAMATRSGTYVMDRTGGHLRLVTGETGRGTWGSGLPAWQPIPKR